MEAASESQLATQDRSFAGARSWLPAMAALAAGLVLRLWMLKEFFEVNGDSLIYGGLAKNLLLHGRYALMGAKGEIYPTLIRLPGYPLFLASCFKVFGMENYASAAWVQIALELIGCLLLADFARRIASTRAGLATLWLGMLCPFTASYCVVPMAETLTLFAIALALWAVEQFWARPGWGYALLFTFAVTLATLLRPDGALVGVALTPALVVGLFSEEHPSGAKAQMPFGAFAARLKSCPFKTRADGEVFCLPQQVRPERRNRPSKLKLTRMAAVCALLALLPFGAWTWRNWQVFHVFEPLAPRYATDPGEDTHPGWERWVKSWCLDFVSTYDIFWNVPDGPLEVSKLPNRAFDSPAEYAETEALAEDYNNGGQTLTHAIDGRFARLAEERVAAHPLRYYLWLPLGRVADMWLRPRVENLYDDLDWWNYAHHPAESRVSWAYAGLNALYLLLGVAGLWMRPRLSTPRTETCPWGPRLSTPRTETCPWGPRLSTPRTETCPWGPRLWPWMLVYMALRSCLLMTVEAPETRYTLECFPMLFVLGGIAIAGWIKVAFSWNATRWQEPA
jgi:hypothetical protein